MRHALFIPTFYHYRYYLSELVTSNVHLIATKKIIGEIIQIPPILLTANRICGILLTWNII